MIKHWKILMTIGFILAIFSVFYVQLQQEVETYPSFTIETKEGELEKIQSIKLYGDYHAESNTHLFSSDLGGTTYVQEMPYLKRLSGFYEYGDIERLKQLYPGYMRGKEEDLSTFTENEFYVIQAGIQWGEYNGMEMDNVAFDLSVLHKELKKQARFTIPIPKADQPSFVSLEDVYAVGEQLHLVTSHFHERKEGLGVYELRIYTVQLDRGKISNSDVVYTWEQNTPAEEIMITSIKNRHSAKVDQRMLLLKRVIQEGVEVGDELTIDEKKSDDIAYEFIAYDFRTKGLETYNLPSQIKDGATFISYENNSDVYVIQEEDEELLIIEWKLGGDEQPDPIVVPTNRTVKSYTTSLIADYLYVYVGDGAQGTNIGEVHVLYVPTGEWVYAGDVISNRPLTSEEEVTIHSIE